MSFFLKNKNALNKYILGQSVRIEKALIYYLESYVAELVKHAKLNQGHSLTKAVGYQRTGNLVASIGGGVFKDGKAVTYKGFEGPNEGESEGKHFIDSIINNFTKGYALVIVAGMEYATYVENYHNLNVLKKTDLKMESEMPLLLNRMKRVIDRL